MSSPPPRTTSELLARASAISGLRLADVAAQLDWAVPADLRRHKGWIGRLVEAALGADAANDSRADFTELGIELKTIPVDRTGGPRESTFVCSVPLAQPDAFCWETSRTRAKLQQVLWIPVLAETTRALADRLIGSPLLWSPSAEQEQRLADDWREHLDVIRRGRVDDITAHDGRVLQIRPKGATSESTTWGVGPGGTSMLTQPRAFYLRTSFTASILERHFAL